MNGYWKWIIPIVIGGCISWAAYNTVLTFGAIQRSEFEEHKKDDLERAEDMNDKIDNNQQRLEDKLQDIYELIINMNEEDNG